MLANHKKSLVQFLQRQSSFSLWIYAITASVILSEVITSCMGWLLKGAVTFDYLLTGLVASFFVAGAVVAGLNYINDQLRQSAREFRELSERLAKSEERATQAMMASHSALWEFDLTTGRVYLSDGWSPFLNDEQKPAHTTIQALSKLVPEEEWEGVRNAIVAALKGPGAVPYQATHRVRKLDGEYMWVLSEGKVTARDKDGRALRMVGINRDITELKHAELQIKSQVEQITRSNIQLQEANQKLEQAQNQLVQSEKMASIGLLAAGVAHEINNPIGYVNSNVGTLGKYVTQLSRVVDKYEEAEQKMNCPPDTLQELHEFKKEIRLQHLRTDVLDLLAETREGLDHVKKIVHDLKDFSHTDLEDHWMWFDITQGIESTLTVVWNELKYKCDIMKEYAALPKIYCLPSRLNQVFMNLLVNAAQSIEERGVIIIRTGVSGSEVWVEIADTGKGIEAQNIKRIFDPFFTTKPVGMGTGLGLSVSYNIVEKHHGRIEVHSRVGMGTTFRIWLPVQHKNGAQSAQAKIAQAAGPA